MRGWLAGSRSLPLETRRYVQAITGISADEWAKGGNREPDKTIPSCRQMMALLKRAPNPFVDKLQERVKLTAESTWGIQLSAGFSREQVLAAYARIANRYAGILSGRDPSILSSVFRTRGTRPFYQVRVGTDTRESANTSAREYAVRAVPALCCATPEADPCDTVMPILGCHRPRMRTIQ